MTHHARSLARLGTIVAVAAGIRHHRANGAERRDGCGGVALLRKTEVALARLGAERRDGCGGTSLLRKTEVGDAMVNIMLARMCRQPLCTACLLVERAAFEAAKPLVSP